jgi:UDP-2,4-diacetamido-2,4,6-trideoxy-beta-L-altropyranose hydrolase
VGGGARDHLVSPRALLCADCGSGVGLGHLERMLALADALKPDVEVVLLVPQGDQALHQRVTDRGHAVIAAPGDAANRVESMVETVASFAAVVLDGYVFDVALQRRLRTRAPLVVVDDLQLPVDCDLAVNPSPGGEDLRPAGATTFLGGAAYALIRAAIVGARDLAIRGGREPRTVLVSTGATDLAEIGSAVTADLLARDGTVEVMRVIGPDSGSPARNHGSRERLLVAPPDLAHALATCTVYVGAAGTTAVQAACVGTPAVITAAVPNQETQAKALACAGCAVVADTAQMAGACLSLLDDPDARATMATRGRALVDGLGAARVAEAIRHLGAARAA